MIYLTKIYPQIYTIIYSFNCLIKNNNILYKKYNKIYIYPIAIMLRLKVDQNISTIEVGTLEACEDLVIDGNGIFQYIWGLAPHFSEIIFT